AEAPVDAAPAPVEAAPAVVEAEAPAAREPRRERGRGRNADRRDAAVEEPRQGNGRPFGDAEIPAFLRRPVTIRG
ncbi:MAG TPA: hypothetical protein VGE03_16155, partial [Brevundimonas sp.]